jgi:bacillithiol biosynthesis cysteine-adding enzyme BshC
MELHTTAVPAANRFASLYIEKSGIVKPFFHYDLAKAGVFRQRYDDIMNKTYNRDGLADCIAAFMDRLPASGATARSLEKLRNPQSAVVIGGQQAGLLTGPLYTIHKIITIITFAEQQEKKLGIPVVPVFWIAGEDHDYQEINHLYMKEDDVLKKVTYPEQFENKKMASEIRFHKEIMKDWIRQVFASLGDKPHTKEMLVLLDEAADHADTLVDFFAFIVASLFQEYGLLLIDSANPFLRKLEKPHFSRLIGLNEEIARAVLSVQGDLGRMGFERAIDADENGANLFLNTENGRELLLYDPAEEVFISRGGEWRLTKEQMQAYLEEHPERFSNNVVTRPLMQEWLFPTLAFIAGPGEIAYWGELKGAFEAAGLAMPPVVPRLNITLLDRKTERDLEALNLTLEEVLQHGTEREKEQFLALMRDRHLDELLEETKDSLLRHYEKIQARIHELDQGHIRLANKNLDFHLGQIDFLKRKVDASIRRKHEAVLKKYTEVEQMLRPDGHPQERIWNIFCFLCEYGRHFIDSLVKIPYDFNGKHHVIRI